MTQKKEPLALRNKVKEEKHLEVYGGGSRVEIGMKPYLHGPMDFREKVETSISRGEPGPPERRTKRYSSSREEEDVVTHMCPCGTTIEGRTHIVGQCAIYKEERDVSRGLDEEL